MYLFQPVFEEVMRVAQRTKSKKVLAQVVHSACALSQCIPPDPKLQDQVIQLALSHITTTKYIILVGVIQYSEFYPASYRIFYYHDHNHMYYNMLSKWDKQLT